MALDILIVDDEEDIRELICGILSDEGFETRAAANSDQAFQAMEARRPSLVILDIWLQGSKLDGLDILDGIRKVHDGLPVIIISGHGNVETAVAAIKRGAFDFIEKPFKADHLIHLVMRATEAERLRRENSELRQRAGLEIELTGQSNHIAILRQSIEKVAPTNSRVLISGPAGSGKETVARLLHARSARAAASFIVANAAATDPSRIEQELFGMERDGAIVRTGLFEQAHCGTLFLDEVAEMPAEVQAKMLRLLTDQTFERAGGVTRVKVDVRVISGTSRNLALEMAAGRFREDLFHRLNVVPLNIPALSRRREDIPALIDCFINLVAAGTGKAPRPLTEEAMAAMQAYDWPGNARQLRNVIERMLILADGDTREPLGIELVPPEVRGEIVEFYRPDLQTQIMSAPLRDAREAFEREYLKVQINRFSGNISKTAEFIGMERSALHRKLKTLGLQNGSRAMEMEQEE